MRNVAKSDMAKVLFVWAVLYMIPDALGILGLVIFVCASYELIFDDEGSGA